MRRLAFISLLLTLVACTVEGTANPSPANPSPSPSIPPTTSSPIFTPAPIFTATATQAVCRETTGRVLITELEDPALPRSLPYRIYVPPCYDFTPGSLLPTLYLLHGLSATDAQWDDLGVDETADRLIASGEIPPFLIVMPWERKGLDFPTAILDSLIPAIEAGYRARPGREWRALGGLSRGGGWTLRIGLQNPDQFASLALHSPAVIAPDLYYVPSWIKGIPADEMPRLWIDIGERDSLRSSTLDLTELLDNLGIAYSWHSLPGYHNAEYWSAHLEAYLRWYAEPWEVQREPGLPGSGSRFLGTAAPTP